MAASSGLQNGMPDLQPARSVLVTGASTGIGRAVALALDARGHRVFAGVRRETDGATLRAASSGRLHPVLLDVTSAASIAAARAEVDVALGPEGLAGLVSNAGVAVTGPLEFLPIEHVRHQFEVNVIGTLAVIQEFAAALRQARGRIVNVGSIGGFISPQMQGPYCASKFALEGLTDSLRRELAPFGVHVALIQPGSVDTPIWEKGLREGRATFDAMPEHARALYGAMSDRSLFYASKTAARGISPNLVAKLVVHALEAKRPRTRYLAGPDAYILRFLTWAFPDRALDWFLQKTA